MDVLIANSAMMAHGPIDMLLIMSIPKAQTSERSSMDTPAP